MIFVFINPTPLRSRAPQVIRATKAAEAAAKAAAEAKAASSSSSGVVADVAADAEQSGGCDVEMEQGKGQRKEEATANGPPSKSASTSYGRDTTSELTGCSRDVGGGSDSRLLRQQSQQQQRQGAASFASTTGAGVLAPASEGAASLPQQASDAVPVCVVADRREGPGVAGDGGSGATSAVAGSTAAASQPPSPPSPAALPR